MIERPISDEERAWAINRLNISRVTYLGEILGCLGPTLGMSAVPAILICILVSGFASLRVMAIILAVFGIVGLVLGIIASIWAISATRVLKQYRVDVLRELEAGVVAEYSGRVEKAWVDDPDSDLPIMTIRFANNDEVVLTRGNQPDRLPLTSARVVMLPSKLLIWPVVVDQ